MLLWIEKNLADAFNQLELELLSLSGSFFRWYCKLNMLLIKFISI